MRLKKEKILGVNINSDKYSEILQCISKAIPKKKKTQIVTPNPEIIVIAQKDTEFRNVINSADISIPDGRGLVWASRILKGSIKQQITGVDLMIDLCSVAAREGWTIFLLGGRYGVGNKAIKVLCQKFPNLQVLGSFEGSPQQEFDVTTKDEIVRASQGKNIDLLFVAYGAPSQEKWISRNLEILPVTIAVGVGGAFNYISGRSKRAPVWIRKIGFEWLFRLITEPWRWKRQLQLIKFIFFIFQNRLKV